MQPNQTHSNISKQRSKKVKEMSPHDNCKSQTQGLHDLQASSSRPWAAEKIASRSKRRAHPWLLWWTRLFQINWAVHLSLTFALYVFVFVCIFGIFGIMMYNVDTHWNHFYRLDLWHLLLPDWTLNATNATLRSPPSNSWLPRTKRVYSDSSAFAASSAGRCWK